MLADRMRATRTCLVLANAAQHLLELLPLVAQGHVGMVLLKCHVPDGLWPRLSAPSQHDRALVLRLRKGCRKVVRQLRRAQAIPATTWASLASTEESGFRYWDRVTASAHAAALEIARDLSRILSLVDLLPPLEHGEHLHAARILQDQVMATCNFLGVDRSGFSTPRPMSGNLVHEIRREAGRALAAAHQAESPVKRPTNGNYVPVSLLVDPQDPRLNSINAVKRAIHRAGDRVRTRPGITKDGREHPQRLEVHRQDFEAEERRLHRATHHELDRISVARADAHRTKKAESDARVQ